MLDRGSECRRWDFHVHTPESALANHYGDWPSYINALEAKGAGVSVIGITDYCSIEGYKKVVEAKAADRLSGFDLVIPNIEFRTHPEMGNGRAINLHILVDPEAKDAILHIERCFGLLTFEYNGIRYPCSTQGLRSLAAHTRTLEAGGRSVYCSSFAELIEALATAERGGRLIEEIRFYTLPALLIVDEVGYLPITPAGPTSSFSWSTPAMKRAP